MPRKRVVSRTIMMVKATAVIYQEAENKTEEREIYYPDAIYDKIYQIEIYLSESNQLNLSSEKLIEIVNKERKEIRYVMLESKFIQYATKGVLINS